jgi:hypothetical protein
MRFSLGLDGSPQETSIHRVDLRRKALKGNNIGTESVRIVAWLDTTSFWLENVELEAELIGTAPPCRASQPLSSGRLPRSVIAAAGMATGS